MIMLPKFELNAVSGLPRLIIVVCLMASAAAHSETIEEIVVKGKVLYANQVTALKTPIPIKDVPQSLSITTEADMLRQGFRAIGDIVNYTPGINTSQGEGHRDAVVFRGVRSTADFYIDGVRDDVEYFRSLYNLDQVEILRGPNALLFGRGGTGGVINRVAKKGEIGQTFGAMNLSSDSFGAFDIAADFNYPTSDRSALRLNVHRDALDNHRDHFGGTRYGINPSLRITFNPATTLDLSYEFADHAQVVDRGIPTLLGRPDAGVKDITFGTSKTNQTTLEAQSYRAYLSHVFSPTSKGNFTLQTSDFDKFYKNLYPSDYTGETVEVDGYADTTERQQVVAGGNLVNEFQTGSVEHTILTGLEWITTKNVNFRYDNLWSDSQQDKSLFTVARPMDFTVTANGRPTELDFTTAPVRHTRSDIDVKSAYVQNQMRLSRTLRMMLGGRIDHFDIIVTDVHRGQAQSRKDQVFSPRAGLIYKPQDSVSIYLSYSESFLPRSGEQFKSLSASAARLDPDVFESRELGLKWDFIDALSLTLAAFKSEQVQAVRDSVSGENSEVIGLQVQGFEVEIKGQFTDQLYIAAGYSRLDGETSTGGEPREIPDYTASLWVNFQVNPLLSLGLGATSQGKSYIANDRPNLVLPSYTRLDLSAAFDFSPSLTLQLHLENALDELYFPNAHGIHQATVGRPLNARVMMRKTL